MTTLNLNEIQKGVGRVKYRGIHILKFPFDYMMYQMIITDIKPDLIIEVGTYGGGSAVYLADLLEINGKGEVHTIDVFPEITVEMSTDQRHFVDHPRIKYFNQGYDGYDLKNAEGFEKVLVIDDASHVYEDVLNSLNKFHHLVPVGSYFIVEDGNCQQLYPTDNRWNGGPLRAVHEFLKTNDQFEIDRTYCDMFGHDSTFNTDGYLKRIK